MLQVGSALLFITAILGVIFGLQTFFMPPFDEQLLGVSLAQIRSFSPNVMDTMTLFAQLSGLYLLTTGLLGCFISAVPFRKGEKWAWYTVLAVLGLGLFGQTALVYFAGALMASYYLPISIVLVIMWAVGLALPAKEILK